MKYGTIVGRIGVILLLTGIVIAVLRQFRSVHRLSSSLIVYVWGGLIVAGAILLVVFAVDFWLSSKRKKA
jgi:uncharacterized membrane protein